MTTHVLNTIVLAAAATPVDRWNSASKPFRSVYSSDSPGGKLLIALILVALVVCCAWKVRSELLRRRKLSDLGLGNTDEEVLPEDNEADSTEEEAFDEEGLPEDGETTDADQETVPDTDEVMPTTQASWPEGDETAATDEDIWPETSEAAAEEAWPENNEPTATDEDMWPEPEPSKSSVSNEES